MRRLLGGLVALAAVVFASCGWSEVGSQARPLSLPRPSPYVVDDHDLAMAISAIRAPEPTTTVPAPPPPASAPVVTIARPKPAPAAPVAVAAPPTTAAPRLAPSPSIESVEQAALGLITYDYRALGYSVVFLPAKPGEQARTFRLEKRIEVYLRTTWTTQELAYIISHEVGHAVDFSLGNPATRAEWMAARGIAPTTDWWGCAGCDDVGSPAGDWAESFATWQVGPVMFRSKLGPAPTAGQLAVLQRLVTS